MKNYLIQIPLSETEVKILKRKCGHDDRSIRRQVAHLVKKYLYGENLASDET